MSARQAFAAMAGVLLGVIGIYVRFVRPWTKRWGRNRCGGASPDARRPDRPAARLRRNRAWTLEVEPDGEQRCVFRTRTRVATTDAESRRRFRRYWAIFSPGILLIRLEMLRMLRAAARRGAGAEPLRSH